MSQAQRLVEAAKSNDIEALYLLLRENPSLLEDIDSIPFVDTPLHIAASSGSTHFAIEILNMKPSFGRKLNPDGLSPLHLAILSDKMQMARRLLEFDPELVRVKGKEGCTPLHYVAGIDGFSELLAQFLVENNKSILDLNIRKESAVHVAVKSGNLNAFKVLFRWIRYSENYRALNWKDEDDNTALHIAVAQKDYEMVKMLLLGRIPYAFSTFVQRSVVNKDGKTALDIAIEFPQNFALGRKIEEILRSEGAKESAQPVGQTHLGPLAQFLVDGKSSYKWMYYGTATRLASWLDNLTSAETRNNLFVVAGLVIAATYQFVLNPPGGLISGDRTTSQEHVGGKVNMGGDLFLTMFVFNSVPFLVSVWLMIMLLPNSFLFTLGSLPLVALSACYGLSAGVISPDSVYHLAHARPIIIGFWGTICGVSTLMVVVVKLFFNYWFD